MSQQQQPPQLPAGRLLSRGKTPTASSGVSTAHNATDTSNGSIWLGDSTLPQWLQITFTAPVTLTGTRASLYWCGLLYDYTLQTSTDGQTFTTVASRTDVPGDIRSKFATDTFQPTKARMLRITITAMRSDPNWDASCFGTSSIDPLPQSGINQQPNMLTTQDNDTDYPPAIGTFEVYGSSPLPRDQNNPPKECPCGSSQGSAGGPFNTRTGALWTDTTDLSLPTDGPPITFQRTYLSRSSDQNSPLGYGWTHSYLTRLLPPTALGGEAGVMKIIAPDGNVDRFDISGTTYTARPGIYSTLVQTDTTFTQTLRDQTRYLFDGATGRLTQIRDAQNHALDLIYDASGRLSRVQSAQVPSRGLALTYTPAGTIDTISDSARTVHYSYTAGDLTTVTDVMGQATTYAYQNHLLTGITNALGQALERTEYDAYLPTGKVIRQTLQDGRHLEVGYATNTTIITTTGVDGRADVKREDYTDDGTLTSTVTNQVTTRQFVFDEGFAPGGITDANGIPTVASYNGMGQPTQTTDTQGHTTQFAYDALHRPLFITDTLGRQVSMSYDASGNLVRQVMGITPQTPLGFTSAYTYNLRYPGKNWLEEQSGPDGVVTSFSYDALGQRTEQTVGAGTPLAQTTRYEYDAIGRVIAVTTGVGTPLQRTDRTEYNPDNTVARSIQNYVNGVYDPAAPDEDSITTYRYDLNGRQVAVTNVLGVTDATHYDAAGRTDWSIRNLQPAQFDAQGLPVLQPFATAAPDANVATFYGYDGLGRTAFVTETGILTGTFDPVTLRFSDTSQRVTRTEYDALSRPVTVTLNYRPDLPIGAAADANVQTITRYDAVGNPTWQRDALGRWTNTQYDVLNRPYIIIQNYENGDPTTVDAANRSWTDGSDTDLVTQLAYTDDGKPRVQLANASHQYVSQPEWAFTPTKPITDRVTLTEYDVLGRVSTTTTNYTLSGATGAGELNRKSVTTYDAASRVQASQDALGRWTSQQYDALSRVVASIQNCRTSANVAARTGCAPYDPATPDRNVRIEMRYDALGRVQETVDPLSVVARTEYDRLGRPTSQIANYVAGQSSTSTRNVTTHTVYNGLGWVTKSTDAVGAESTSSYDALGRLVSVTDPLSRERRIGYDGTGAQRWTREPDGRVTVLLVDGLGRVVRTMGNYQDGQVTSADGTDRDLITRTVYDIAGRVVQSVDAGGRATRQSYDLLDRLTSVTENATDSTCALAPCNVVTRYTYDRVGNRTAITDALSHTQRFVYDAADQQVQALDALGQITRFQYDAGGRLTSRSDPRGTANNVSYSYDGLDRQTGVSASNLGAISMQYDGRGQRTKLIDPTGTTSFNYDPLGRVSQVVAPNTGSVGYSYNARGQRTQLTYPDNSAVSYDYWGDGQLKAVLQGSTTLASYSYDANGRLSSVSRANGAVTVSRYDQADRLTELHTTVGGANVSHFSYTLDRQGQRTGVTEVFGSTSAPGRVADINPSGGSAISSIVAMGSSVYFLANDGTHGEELWRSDGTAAGTSLVKDIVPGSDGSSPSALTVVGSKLFFVAYEPSSGQELWVTDGTEAGTTLVKDIRSGTIGGLLFNLTAGANRLFFTADDGVNGQELWVSDGTAAGTSLVKDIRAGSNSSSPASLIRWDNGVLFSANDGTVGSELWVSDGTAAGTSLVKDIRSGSSGSGISSPTVLGSRVLFRADDGVSGAELWATDGSSAGTVLLKDIAAGVSGSSPANLRTVGTKVFFSAYTSAEGQELWVTDGSSAGTVLVKDIWPGSIGASPGSLTAVGSRLFFTANTGAEGQELWVSDGTAAGTALVKDIRPGSASGNVLSLTAVGSRVFFTANDGSSGQELWVSDGTAARTTQLAELVAGSGSASPANLIVSGERLFFRANDGVSGTELWAQRTALPTTRTIAYTYDGLQRLIQSQEQGASTTTYTYDLAGNRTTLVNSEGSTSMGYDAANQALGWSYDGAGNLLRDGGRVYSYDALGRVTQVDGTTYTYNGDGVLMAQTTGGVTTRYTQDLASPLSQVLSDGSASYIYGDGPERLRALNGPWYLADGLGSVRATLDDGGATTATASYHDWGGVQGSQIAPFGFTGELQDRSFDLVHLRARWYNTVNGTFTSRDPFAGYPEQPYSLHPYQYAYSNPLRWQDPSGRCIPQDVPGIGEEGCHFIGWNPVNWNWADGVQYYYGPAGTIGKLALMALFPPAAFVYGVENAGVSYLRYREDPSTCNKVLFIVDGVLAVLPFASFLKIGGGGLGAVLKGANEGTLVLSSAQTRLISLEAASLAVGVGQIPNVFYAKSNRESHDPSGDGDEPQAPRGNLKTPSDSYWLKLGIEPHEVKSFFLGKRAPIKEFDLAKDSDGYVWVIRKARRDTSVPPIRAGTLEEIIAWFGHNK